MKRLTVISGTLLLLVSLFWVSSCSPRTKDAYLQKFEQFIQDVEESRTDYSEKDWEKAEKTYDKFRYEWYNDFKESFSISEGLKLTSLEAKWLYYRSISKVGDTINSIDTQELKSKAKSFKDELKDDLQGLGEALDNIIDSLSVNVNKKEGSSI